MDRRDDEEGDKSEGACYGESMVKECREAVHAARLCSSGPEQLTTKGSHWALSVMVPRVHPMHTHAYPRFGVPE